MIDAHDGRDDTNHLIAGLAGALYDKLDADGSRLLELASERLQLPS